jgi:membrane glycosyltransferase
VFYRRRLDNEGRKAGNIADWVRRFGAAYPHFVILDADSVMTAETLEALLGAMQRHPDIGLIQTLPVLHRGRTLFARLQQFAGAVHGPLIAAGLSLWHGAAGNYWGHNAIIRTRAFAECCGLPRLPGRKPFGGDIMSHDFVEAAMLRRAGWGVHMAPFLGGSFEEGPPTLPDMAARDRRWCQGNIQHMAVIGARGLHPLSRLHMATGIFAYLSAPLWLLFLLLGIAVSLQAGLLPHDYFPDAYSLFPAWPIVDPDRAIVVFTATMALLLAPKLLAAVAHAFSRRAYGLRALGLGTLAELVISALMSPIMMLWQSRMCLAVLAGRDGGWSAQRRDAGRFSWGEAWRLGRMPVLAGVGLVALGWSAPSLLAWMSPVLAGLLGAPLLLRLTASERAGSRFGAFMQAEAVASRDELAGRGASDREALSPVRG